jgi:uncharacterized membrane protein YoaT (DUF817 family)
MLPLLPRLDNLVISQLLMMIILTSFRIEAVKHLRIVLLYLVVLLLWCLFVILCLRQEALLQIGVIEE